MWWGSWYCGTDRTFDDETILIQHQRTKHFQCPTCHKKLTTATALKTHCLYVHKEEINRVPNARDGRDAFDFDIVGMDGVAAAEEAAEIAADPSKRQKTGPAAPSAAAPPAPGAAVSVAQPYAQIAQQMAAQMGIPQPGMPYGAIPGMPGVPMPYPGMMQQNQWQQQQRPPQPPQPPNPYGQPQPPPNPYGQQPPNPYQQQPPPQPMGYPNYGTPQSQSVSLYPPPQPPPPQYGQPQEAYGQSQQPYGQPISSSHGPAPPSGPPLPPGPPQYGMKQEQAGSTAQLPDAPQNNQVYLVFDDGQLSMEEKVCCFPLLSASYAHVVGVLERCMRSRACIMRRQNFSLFPKHALSQSLGTFISILGTLPLLAPSHSLSTRTSNTHTLSLLHSHAYPLFHPHA